MALVLLPQYPGQLCAAVGQLTVRSWLNRSRASAPRVLQEIPSVETFQTELCRRIVIPVSGLSRSPQTCLFLNDSGGVMPASCRHLAKYKPHVGATSRR